MKLTRSLMIGSLLFVLCSCGDKAPDSSSSSQFLSAKMETVMEMRPDSTEEAVLQYLKEFAAKVEMPTSIPGEGVTTVKYHTGLSHSGNGMIVNGSRSKNPDVPPAKSYYHEFHYDSEGKLSHIVENDNGNRSLSNLFYYDGADPMAKILFVQGKHSYSDLAFYIDKAMYLKCRIAADGKVISGGLLANNH